jgi:hypothetical protein
MSFRQNNDETREWKGWLQAQRSQLVACGVPLTVLENREHWFYFRDHGCFTPSGGSKPIIDVDHMNEADIERLCAFLETDGFYPRSAALNRLQYLLKRGPHNRA